jgi:hypothetical protein
MTAQEIFEITVDLISERLDTGLVDDTNTLNYQKRTPGLLTMLQNEICRKSPIYKTQTITSSGTSGYVIVDLPSDFIAVYQLYNSDLELYEDFKRIGNDLYVPFDFSGTLVYRYIPVAITKLTDELDFDNQISSLILPNGLAGQLLLNSNEDLANYFNSRYEELLREIKTRQSEPIMKRKDIYGASCTF